MDKQKGTITFGSSQQIPNCNFKYFCETLGARKNHHAMSFHVGRHAFGSKWKASSVHVARVFATVKSPILELADLAELVHGLSVLPPAWLPNQLPWHLRSFCISPYRCHSSIMSCSINRHHQHILETTKDRPSPRRANRLPPSIIAQLRDALSMCSRFMDSWDHPFQAS